MSKRNIPSEEDFRRAKAADRERHRGLSDVSEQIQKRFGKSGVHEVFMLYSSKTPNTFYSRIFYRWTRQIEEAEKSGLVSQIKDAVYEELEQVGRGDRSRITVDFEFDSHENVERDYGGNYFDRLR